MSGTNKLVVSKSTLENASASTLAKNLLNANEVAKQATKKAEPKKK